LELEFNLHFLFLSFFFSKKNKRKERKERKRAGGSPFDEFGVLSSKNRLSLIAALLGAYRIEQAYFHCGYRQEQKIILHFQVLSQDERSWTGATCSKK